MAHAGPGTSRLSMWGFSTAAYCLRLLLAGVSFYKGQHGGGVFQFIFEEFG